MDFLLFLLLRLSFSNLGFEHLYSFLFYGGKKKKNNQKNKNKKKIGARFYGLVVF